MGKPKYDEEVKYNVCLTTTLYMVIPWERKIIMQLNEITYAMSGIYKITFDNKKIYIGRTNSLKRRMNEHCGKDIKEHSDLPISKAILKHKIIDVSIIEEIEPENFSKMKSQEKYWIKEYNSFLDKTVGYNISEGGEGADYGIYNVSALIKSEELLNKIVDLLLNSTLTYQEICEEVGLPNNRYIITHINSGKHYHNPSLSYPLRKVDIKRSEFENKQSLFYNNKDLLLQLIELLKDPSIPFAEIEKRLGISCSIICLVNTGKKYALEEYKYPIRKKNSSRRKVLSNNELNQIKDLLSLTKLNMSDIGKRFQISRDIVSQINKGERQKQNDWQYPLRTIK